MTVVRDIELIHPVAKASFLQLRDGLQTMWLKGLTQTKFEIFETYRSPLRQEIVKAAGNSKASAYDSAHQYGLAVDFVPRNNGQWSWDMKHDWDLLRRESRRLGLLNELSWDRAHVEHPSWTVIKQELKRPWILRHTA